MITLAGADETKGSFVTSRVERKGALLRWGLLAGLAIGAGLGVLLPLAAVVIPPFQPPQLLPLWIVIGLTGGALSGLFGGLVASLLAIAFASAARVAGIRPACGVATGAWTGSSAMTLFTVTQLLAVPVPAAIVAAILAGAVGARIQVGVWTGWRPKSRRRGQSVSA